MHLKPNLLVLLVLAIALGAGIRAAPFAEADAVGAPALSSTTVEVGATIHVVALYSDDSVDPDVGAILRTDSAIGVFISPTTVTQSDGTYRPLIVGISTGQLTLLPDDDGGDGQNTGEVEEQTVIDATFRCDSAGTTTFTIIDPLDESGSPYEETSAELTCTEPPATGANVYVQASPGNLECGGTTELTAYLVTSDGQIVTDLIFIFSTTQGEFSSGNGDDNTAELTIDPYMGPEIQLNVETVYNGESINSSGHPFTLHNHCAGDIASIAVVANPSVIQCGGSSLITATARDKAGQIIEGVGFNFQIQHSEDEDDDVGEGLLLPQPDADQIINAAVLTFGPGQNTDREVEVTASVGTVTGSVQVQQFCAGVSTDGSTAPGLISLTSSEKNLVCGQTAFIGARVKDSKLQTPTTASVSFLATAGTFKPIDAAFDAPETIGITGTAAEGTGTLNVVYIAPTYDINADVRITAASGDAFSEMKLHVTCGSGVVNSGTGGCLTANGQVCITPPNTGSGGLKR